LAACYTRTMGLELPVKKKSTKKKNKAIQVLEARKNDLISEAQGAILLNRYLKEEFDPVRLKKMVQDLCEASDTRYNIGAGFYKTPNWAARDKGIDRVLKMLKYIQKEEGVSQTNHPTQIIFNVIKNVEVKKSDGRR